MSTYPSADDYAFALEPARFAKHLQGDAPLLRAVRTGKLTIPKGAHYAHVAYGAFAYIYRVRTAQGEYALRCPRLRFPGNSAARYQGLAQFLRAKPDANYLVEADHFDDALFVSVGSQGTRFPIQVMGWVDGKTLLEVVAERTKAGDAKGLLALAEAWENLLIALKSDGVVHGDLHPDNVIVSPDNTLRLVDYDTLIVPGFTPEATALGGMETYCHPGYERNQVPRPTVSYLDDFGALNILLSLQALAANPYLRATREYLLFRTEDIECPTTSRLFVGLCHHANAQIAQLANAFFDECCAPMETGNLRVEHFLPVTPAPIPWHYDPPTPILSGTSPLKSHAHASGNANISVERQAWQPAEDAMPSSMGEGSQEVGRRTHGMGSLDTMLPSSAGQTDRRTYPYEPK